MHHKNHKFSTANHNNPSHIKPNDLPTGPSPGGASTMKKPSFLSNLRDKFKEKPATAEEIGQLRLNTQREELKTRMKKAKMARPSRFGFMESNQPSYRKQSSFRQQEDNSLFGSSKSGGGFLDSSWSPSFSMFGGTPEKKGKKNQGSGLEDLF